jgi:ABC-type antimicrobial peptide transport system permease subunit
MRGRRRQWWISRPWRFVRARGGAIAIEFAIIAPVLLAFIIGIIEFGQAMHTNSSLEYAVERASRFAMIDAEIADDTLRDHVYDSLIGIESDLVTVTISEETVSGITYKSIEAEYNYPFITYGSTTLTAKSRVPVS